VGKGVIGKPSESRNSDLDGYGEKTMKERRVTSKDKKSFWKGEGWVSSFCCAGKGKEGIRDRRD